jgi:hypothetical protein
MEDGKDDIISESIRLDADWLHPFIKKKWNIKNNKPGFIFKN